MTGDKASRLLWLVGATCALVACGGGGGDGAATRQPAGAPGGEGPLAIALDAPQVAADDRRRIALSWQLTGTASSVTVQVQPIAGAAFVPVAADVAGSAARFSRGAARQYDFPTAQVRVEACDAANQCVQSNAQPLAAVLLGGSAQLHANPPAADAVFGSPLSFSADGNRVAVTAQANRWEGPDGDYPQRGQVFVYDRAADGEWTQTALLERPEVLNAFGGRVALSGDGNTLVVPSTTDAGTVGGIDAPEVPGLDQPGGSNDRGAVHVYVRGSAGAWTRQAFIKPSTTVAAEAFGSASSLSVDGNTLAVSAAQRVVLFRRDAAGWHELRIFDGASHGALSGDGATLAMARLLPPCPPLQPQPVPVVDVWRRGAGTTTWTQVAALTAAGAGTRIGSNPVLDHDGDTLAVGAADDGASDDDGAPAAGQAVDSGAVLVFRPDLVGLWTQRALLKSRRAQAGDRLGSEVRLSADGRVIAAGARGMVQNVPGLRRNHAAGAEIDPALLAEVGELGGAVYQFEADAAGQWTHVANALLGEPGVPWSQPFFGFDLSADGGTLGLGSTVFTSPDKDAYVLVL